MVDARIRDNKPHLEGTGSMGDPITIAKSVAAPLTDALGITKPGITVGPASPGGTAVDQNKAADAERAEERRRRQAIAAQNRLTKTSSLGASLKEMPLGGGNQIQAS